MVSASALATGTSARRLMPATSVQVWEAACLADFRSGGVLRPFVGSAVGGQGRLSCKRQPAWQTFDGGVFCARWWTPQWLGRAGQF